MKKGFWLQHRRTYNAEIVGLNTAQVAAAVKISAGKYNKKRREFC